MITPGIFESFIKLFHSGINLLRKNAGESFQLFKKAMLGNLAILAIKSMHKDLGFAHEINGKKREVQTYLRGFPEWSDLNNEERLLNLFYAFSIMIYGDGQTMTHTITGFLEDHSFRAQLGMLKYSDIASCAQNSIAIRPLVQSSASVWVDLQAFSAPVIVYLLTLANAVDADPSRVSTFTECFKENNLMLTNGIWGHCYSKNTCQQCRTMITRQK